jgi:hypothetical protein
MRVGGWYIDDWHHLGVSSKRTRGTGRGMRKCDFLLVIAVLLLCWICGPI